MTLPRIEHFTASRVVEKQEQNGGPDRYVVIRETCVRAQEFMLAFQGMQEKFVEQYEQLRRSVAPLEAELTALNAENERLKADKIVYLSICALRPATGCICTAVLSALRERAEARE